MEIYRGDIFYIENNYRTEGSEQREGRPALVVSNNTGNHFSEIVSVVWLTTAEKKPLPTHCEVMSRVPSTAICEQVVTISQNRLGNYIRTATEAEMKNVDRCLMVALGLDSEKPKEQVVATAGMIDELVMKLEGAERALDDRKAMLEEAQKQISDAHEHIERLLKENAELEELKNQPVFPPDPEEVVKLKAQVEMLERQNERLLDRLIG